MPKKTRTPEQKAARRIHDALNAGKIRAYNKKYKTENRIILLEKKRVYNLANADAIKDKRRQYYLANREKYNQQSRAWHEKNHERANELSRRWNAEHPEPIKERNKKWYHDNIEYVKEQRRLAKLDPEKMALEREQRKKRRAKNRDRVLEKSRAYRKLRQPIYITRKRNKRAAARGAEGAVTYEDIMALWERQKGRCVFFASCGNFLEKKKNGYHADHIEPICPQNPNRPVGTNRIDNYQLLCVPCNVRKSNKDPYKFAQANGLLFCDIVEIAQKPAHRRRAN